MDEEQYEETYPPDLDIETYPPDLDMEIYPPELNEEVLPPVYNFHTLPPELNDLLHVKVRLEHTMGKVTEAIKRREKHIDSEVTVVAVGKLKPIELIVEAYNQGHRHFGENYVNELQEKSNNLTIVELCPEIKWHFIGHVQSNKIKKLVVGCPNLHMVHTIDSVKVADIFNKAWEIMLTSDPLNIFIQVNTSREPSKSGVEVEDAEMIIDHVINKCPQLKVRGLMTIGSPNHNLQSGPNPDYLALINLRNVLEMKFKIPLELSMGMSGDFEHAIELGSNFVRIGEKIFGPRHPTPPICSHSRENRFQDL